MSDVPAPPDIAGYRLLRPLGRGGMATAWLAQQLSLGREVAIKVLEPGLARDAGFVERFLREGRVLAAMHHRNIVAVHDVGMSGDTPYLAMEYLPQGSVATRCGQCDVATTLRCVREIASALEHAHAKGVIHRDVKPENILQHEDGSFLLGDFGIARQLDTSTAFGAAGQTLGTPHYMSPERWRNEPFDGRADLYSLGGVLYALASGKPPYEAEDAFVIGMQHMSAPIPTLPPSHAALQGLLARLMAKDPGQRAPDARSVVEHAQALERELALVHSDSGPVPRHGPGTERLLSEWPFGGAKALLDLPAPWYRRPTTLIAAVLGAALALALLAYVLLPQLAGRFDAARGTNAGANPLSIAIMPFVARDDDGALATLGVVISDDVANQLARDAQFRVAPRSATVELEAHQLEPAEVARRLRVEHVLEGAISRRGTEVIVEAKLSSAGGGPPALDRRFEAPASEVWRLERNLAATVAAVLSSGRPAVAPASAPQVSASAYVAYLRGRQKMVGAPSDEDLEDAAAAFNEALAIDPDYVLARAALCRAEIARFERRRDAAALAGADASCTSAEMAAPSNPDVLVALGDLNRVRSSHAVAIDYYQRAAADAALELDAVRGMARSQAALRNDTEAERLFARARSLQPGFWRTYYELAQFYYARSRYDDAIENFRTALSLSPENSASINNNLGAVYLANDAFESAQRAFAESVAQRPNASAVSNLGTVHFFLRDYPEAVKMFRFAVELGAGDYRMYGNLADALALSQAPREEVLAQYRNAVERAQTFLAAQRDSQIATVELAWYLLNLGEEKRARMLLDSAAASEVSDGEVAFRIAASYARLGESELERTWARRAAELGFSPRILASNPWVRLAGG
jgi:tetratricopeptide (TPR) repeat protein/TolB-like protein